MPFKARRPAGGFKVMYEYANRLSALGYSVHITYSLQTRYMKYRLPYFSRLLLSYIEGFRTDKWFVFNPSITMSYAKSVSDKYIVDSDIIITTWWSTVVDVGKLSLAKGKKINLIQGYEDWEGHVDELHSSYNIKNIYNVVVATYLKNLVGKYTNNPIVFIPNAIDRNKFNINIPIDRRNSKTICMLYSIQEIKGSEYGMEALELVHKLHPDLQVELFGICPEPENLPNWIHYYHNPSNLAAIYNHNSIFISNSLTEGFGLVSVEAMACGCALICTDILGHREYAFDEDTALLVDVQNPQQMAEKILFLINNRKHQMDIAQRGYEYVQRFSWDSSVEKMDNLIKSILDN